MSRKMNAGGAATMALKVAEVTAGAPELVLVVVRDDLTRRIDTMVKARQAKVEAKPLVASANIDSGFARPVVYPTAEEGRQ
jgi:hypothetical protein